MRSAERPGGLVAIAGGIGSGKSTIAAAVSRRTGIPVHSIDDDKLAVATHHQEFEQWVADAVPFPDAFRREVYERTLARLDALAGSHDWVIVEETFHRRPLREPFFERAAAILGRLVLIEVTVSPDVALEHLRHRAEDDADHLAGRAMYEAFAAIADPIDNADIVVENNGDLQTAVDAVCSYLETVV